MTPAASLRRFDRKIILVTGAASGIGLAVARRLASEGATLVLADRNMDGLDAAVTEIGALGSETKGIGYDAASVSASRDMVDQAVAAHGRLDAVLNIGGIYRRAHFQDTGMEDWAQVMAVNLTSVVTIIQQALPALIESRGNIVNTGSTAGLDGIAYAAPYAASKAAVINLTRSVAAEFAHLGVRANVVCPGRVKTAIGAGLAPLSDLRADIANHPARLQGLEEGGDPEHLAGAFAYLASDDAAYVSGSVLLVDGAKSAG